MQYGVYSGSDHTNCVCETDTFSTQGGRVWVERYLQQIQIETETFSTQGGRVWGGGEIPATNPD